MDLGAGELQDWELLHKSDESSPINSPKSVDSTKGFEVKNIIRSNYFSFDSLNKYLPHQESYVTEEGSVLSGSKSLIDFMECKFGEFDGKGQLGVVEKNKIQVGFGGIGEIVDESENIEVGVGHVSLGSKFGEFDGKGQLGGVENDKIRVGFGGIGEIGDESENIEVDVGRVSFGSKFGEFDGKGQLGGVEIDKFQGGFGGIGEIVDESENIEVGVGPVSLGSKFGEFDGEGQLGGVENDKIQVGFGIGEIVDESEKFEMGVVDHVGSVRADDCKFTGKDELGVVENDEIEVGFGGIGEILAEEGSVRSDDPSWIEPGLETHYLMKESGEFSSDSNNDQSDELNIGQFDAKNQVDVVENEEIRVNFQGTEEIVAESEDSGKIWSDSSGTESFPMKLEENSVRVGDDENLREEMEFSGDEKVEDGKKTSGNEIVSVEAKSGGGEEKRSMVWWKFPLEFLKYCVFRVSPVWTISVAAAMMGFAILGRRLYMMKRKSRSLQINVTVDDKKVSQVVSRVARLNEAFSIVRRVPIVRPSLPAAGVTPWPIMSLR